jgi:Xaa-Pro dipeptidase
LLTAVRYFNRYAMENGYLHIPDYAKHINTEILEKYYPVGGVRIEDDILVTEDGYENLTTAPKGEVACEIIRQDKIKATAARDSPSKRFWEFKMM